MDDVLFDISYDYVGDLAETISLVWPAKPGANRAPPLSEIVETLLEASRAEGPALVAGWLDALDASGRWALIKLVTGGLRIGVSARLAKQALANFGDKDVTEIEELWHGLEPPYTALFQWLGGEADKPVSAAAAPFRPVMLAHALDEKDLPAIDPEIFAAGMEMGRHTRAGERRGRRAPTLFAHGGRYRPRLPGHYRGARFQRLD